jgi:hypothetical protein
MVITTHLTLEFMQLETDAGGNCAFTPHVCCASRPNNDVDWAAQESKSASSCLPFLSF